MDIAIISHVHRRQEGKPEGLWESMLCYLKDNILPEYESPLHTAYLHNQSFTKHLPKSTPYEGWYNKKPNVSHLCEFGAPVWILLQGQKIDQNMQPKTNGEFMSVLMMVLGL